MDYSRLAARSSFGENVVASMAFHTLSCFFVMKEMGPHGRD